MSVPCPHCGFLVALIASEGGAPQHCPRCGGALKAPSDAPGMAEIGSGPVPRATTGDATAPDDPLAAVIANAAAAARDEAVVAPVGDAAPTPRTTHRRPARKRDSPSFVRKSATAMPSGPRWPGLLVVGVLLLALLTQLLLVQRGELAASARWRPMIGAVCAVLRCELPPWHEPAAITMLNRSVQPHPRNPGVLLVHASFRNDAHWPQGWPVLVLSLADVDGREVGRRAFRPEEYRGAAGPTAELAPGQSASVQFEVIEPAPRIVAFTFDFR